MQLGASNMANHPDLVTMYLLKVVKADWRTSYVAYSHVWSEGLGNATDNALPLCQIERLRSQLVDLPAPTTSQNLDGLGLDQKMHLRTHHRDESYGQLFWLDTLCVPAQPNYHHLRLKTINHMAAIYALADRVLVLDSELQGQRIATSQDTDLLAYAAFSAWNARCWTLQEGALARSLPVAGPNEQQGCPISSVTSMAGQLQGLHQCPRLPYNVWWVVVCQGRGKALAQGAGAQADFHLPRCHQELALSILAPSLRRAITSIREETRAYRQP
ncbi:hypothetical protein M8818_002624 [Zalaria obscura]|uniref:Uncharacterized protein n=1 Tax=Zalaria obscura TaxID=2024903 RepID=A0ACC3SHI5_9PEZI